MSDDTSTINQVRFNKIGADYDQRYRTTIGILENEVRTAKEFIGVKSGGRLLDYACGTGLLTRLNFMRCTLWALGDDLGQCVGIDLSESMIEAYNTKARSQGFTPQTRTAHLGNLLLPSDASPSDLAGQEFFNFDVVGVGLGFHHFDDPELATRRMAERLSPGGVLFILDFLPHAVAAVHGHHHDATLGITHHGFSAERMRGMFKSAGVGGDFRFKELEVDFPSSHGHGGESKVTKRKVFFARGAKMFVR